MSQATIVLREEPYFLFHHWYRVPQDIFVSDWGRFHQVYISQRRKPNKFSGRYTFLRGVRLCPLNFPRALWVFKHVMHSFVIVWHTFINNYRFLSRDVSFETLNGGQFALSTQLKITELPYKISNLKWSKSYFPGRIFTNSLFQILRLKSHSHSNKFHSI